MKARHDIHFSDSIFKPVKKYSSLNIVFNLTKVGLILCSPLFFKWSVENLPKSINQKEERVSPSTFKRKILPNKVAKGEVRRKKKLSVKRKKKIVSKAMKQSPVHESSAISSINTSLAASAKKWRMPEIILPIDADSSMREALKLVNQFANSDDFYQYLNRKMIRLSGGNETNIELSIKKFRNCLHNSSPISVYWKDYSKVDQNQVIGGWNGYRMNQNKFHRLNPIERAGHWIHEISHACGFTHEVHGQLVNDIEKYPIIRNSFPYQVGYAFEDFLSEKSSPSVASTK